MFYGSIIADFLQFCNRADEYFNKETRRGSRPAAYAALFRSPGRSGYLHLASVKLRDLPDARFARVAGTAGVRERAFGKKLDVLFFKNAFEVGGDAHVGGKFFDCRDRRVGGFRVGVRLMIEAGEILTKSDV